MSYSAGDLSTAADALSLFAISAAYAEEGLTEAARSADDAIEIAKRSGDQRVLAAALHRRGGLFGGQREYEKAKAVTAEALDIRREAGDLDGQAASLAQLASIHSSPSLGVETRRYMEEALEVVRSLGDRLKLAAMLGQSAWIIDVEPGEQMRMLEEVSDPPCRSLEGSGGSGRGALLPLEYFSARP